MKRALFAIYATGTASSSIALVYIDPPTIAGVDAGSAIYQGDIIYDELENLYHVNLTMKTPIGTPLISGSINTAEIANSLIFDLPKTFANGETIRLDLPFGPTNVRFEKIMDLDI